MKVVDFIASTKKSRLVESPAAIAEKSIGVDFDGWLMPRSGLAFVWVLPEVPAQPERLAGRASNAGEYDAVEPTDGSE